jgi:hypothetical protein
LPITDTAQGKVKNNKKNKNNKEKVLVTTSQKTNLNKTFTLKIVEK